MLKLHYSTFSPFARRVRVVLEELGLTYESDLQNRLRPVDEIATLSPALQVPVLFDGERPVFGSLLIQEYLLATNAPNARHGDRPLATGPTRSASHWDDRQVLVAIDIASDAYLVIRSSEASPDASPYLARHMERIHHILDWLETRLRNAGEEMVFWPGMLSLADINLFCLLDHAISRGVLPNLDRWPKTQRLAEACSTRSSFIATAYPQV